MRYRGLWGAVGALVSGWAFAHSPYLLPNLFDATDRDHVTVEGSFTETFFTPDVAMKSDVYHVLGPDGAKQTLTPAYFKDLALVEVPTARNGTYRISTGQRSGRTAKAALIDGKWEFLREGKAVPGGAKVYDMKSITTADVFVSRGAPTDAALMPRKVGLEFRPITHPNKLFVGTEVQFEALFNGTPLAQQTIAIHGDDERYAQKKPLLEIATDVQGRFSAKIDRPGVYLAMTRHRLEPQAAGAPAESHTYSVTFEVTE